MSDQEEAEYVLVRSSYRNRSYLRRKPRTARMPTGTQREVRAAFARIATEKGRGKRGTVLVEKDGAVKEIPASALPVMLELRGQRFAPTGVVGAETSTTEMLNPDS